MLEHWGVTTDIPPSPVKGKKEADFLRIIRRYTVSLIEEKTKEDDAA